MPTGPLSKIDYSERIPNNVSLAENRRLLRMALSQYRLDESAEVLLHLLVSRADANADALRPLMSTGRVTVQAYRRLTWGGRAGLLLEAA